ncbi:MAG: restriction endonuclease, partial [Clostridia bacterium]|nr:restriction endonuclease [Clostridia bacterium]
LNMFTYQMSEIIRDELSQGVEIDGEQREYAFDLNEFFAANASGRFVHESAVDKFLDALTAQTKFPFSTPELRDELRHTFWLLNRVDSAKALKRKLEAHPVFRNYEIVLAAGDGRMDGDDQAENAKAFDRVGKAIKEHEYTITLSVGQLTTGITIPEWTAVLMLSSIKSPALYMQAAFRAQNPCTFLRGGAYLKKENAYVFDFDPARTLIIFEQFANDLSPDTADGRGDAEQRRKNIRTLLNFFPVIGEDEGGEMVELDAEKVLSIPRRIKSQEVVRSGFQNNYLFTDAIGVVFRAPQEVIDIITSFTPAEEPNKRAEVTPQTAEDLSIDGNGEVSISDEHVIGLETAVFGEKVYDIRPDALEDIVPVYDDPAPASAREKLRETITGAVTEQVIKPVMDQVRNQYGDGFRKSDQKRTESRLNAGAEAIVHEHESEYHIEQKRLEQERDEMLDLAETEEDRAFVQQDFEKKADEARKDFMTALGQAITEFQEEAKKEAVRQAETSVKEAEKREQESRIRDHLRGFSRTIPSFLMAYGDDSVTLQSFDQVIPDAVFREVTGIGLADFRKLRDGGTYVDSEGQEHSYPGLFDEVVFDDSIREFLRLRAELADYFDEEQTGDIFDYIPPQKTNQIFTPKRVVKQMVDMLEEENPGCFDRDDKTFADLYMKSGLYIAEVVKRLYRSEAMKQKYPDRAARLRHIFAHQVYGLAPTEIIYRIAVRFLLGFDDGVVIDSHHLRRLDSLVYAKDGTLGEKLDEVFG